MGFARSSSHTRLTFFLLCSTIALNATLSAARTPARFTEKLVANGLASPTAMQFAPDGRLFVAEQGGRLRVIENGTLLPTPFLTVTVNASGERGLLGVAFDPNFAANQFLYVYYTATTPTLHNRISRFTANGNTAVAGSEVAVLELDNLSSATNHSGGAIAFAPDGKLYAAVGDNANGANAQSQNTLHGKMLRINKDGTIPADNPFLSSASGKNRAIWGDGPAQPVYVCRSPRRADLHQRRRPNAWEEINDGVRLWVNGQLIINNWTEHAEVENSGTIALTAGQRYDIRMDFYDLRGLATAKLLWSSRPTVKAVVPTARLFPVP